MSKMAVPVLFHLIIFKFFSMGEMKKKRGEGERGGGRGGRIFDSIVLYTTTTTTKGG